MAQTIATPFGNLSATWTEQGLYACEFERDPPDASAIARDGVTEIVPPRRLASQLDRQLSEYFATGQLEWSLQTLDWTGVSEFHQAVLRHCHSIPAGQTVTYGRLAALAGSPQAARAVGSAMAKNRWPLLIPCHRVVGAGGQLTGYSGRGGTATKQRLLELEAAAVGRQLQPLLALHSAG